MPLFANNFDAFGLDIGDRSLKAAYIKKRGRTPRLLAYNSLSLAPGILERGGILKVEEFVSQVRQLVRASRGKKIKTPYVHACLPETAAFIKLLSLKLANENELPAAIREELPNHVPLPFDDLYVDWQIIEKSEAELKVLVGAVERRIADAYTSALLAAGLSPVSLQIEAEAILRCLLPLHEPPTSSIAIVDFGATRSSFICFDQGTIQFTVTLETSSDNITDLIAQKLQLTSEEAERAKRLCGLDPAGPGEGIAREIVTEAIAKLSADIKKSIGYYQEHFPHGSPIASLILCGGGANLKHLPETLGEQLAPVRVYLSNPLVNLTHNLKKIRERPDGDELNFLNPDLAFAKINTAAPLSPSEALSYTTAIGLALSNVNGV